MRNTMPVAPRNFDPALSTCRQATSYPGGPYKIQALDRAVSLLQVLSSSPTPLLLTEIATRTRLHKSTTQRFLRILHGHDLVRRRTDGRYHLGLRLHGYGEQALQQFDPRDKAFAPFRRLIHEVQETGFLFLLRGDAIVCLDQVLTVKTTTIVPAIGTSAPVHSTPAGKAILAFTPPALKDSIIERIVFPGTAAKREADLRNLHHELHEIRYRGYADEEESVSGSRCIAAPIHNGEGLPFAAISIRGPLLRITPEKLHSLALQLRACCHQIRVDLGYGS